MLPKRKIRPQQNWRSSPLGRGKEGQEVDTVCFGGEKFPAALESSLCVSVFHLLSKQTPISSVPNRVPQLSHPPSLICLFLCVLGKRNKPDVLPSGKWTQKSSSLPEGALPHLPEFPSRPSHHSLWAQLL